MPRRRAPQYLHRRLADAVATRRQELGISQEELALRCGLHRTYIGGIERAERNISLATLERIADGLGLPASALLK
ncbi:MAG: helix-turn-helix transcriptional regulator [Acidimicrobiia bacterium]